MVVNSWVLYQKIVGKIKINMFKRKIFIKQQHLLKDINWKKLAHTEKGENDVADVIKNMPKQKTPMKPVKNQN
eukprot:gene28537-34672_t